MCVVLTWSVWEARHGPRHSDHRRQKCRFTAHINKPARTANGQTCKTFQETPRTIMQLDMSRTKSFTQCPPDTVLIFEGTQNILPAEN